MINASCILSSETGRVLPKTGQDRWLGLKITNFFNFHIKIFMEWSYFELEMCLSQTLYQGIQKTKI